MGVMQNNMSVAWSAPATSGGTLAGRAAELARLERLLERLRTRESDVLVLRGEPGIGKTALLDHFAAHAKGLRIVRLRGVESEMELPFASLHLLCGSLRDGMPFLQPAQRAALETAIGPHEGPADRFLVGLAVLELFVAAAARQPLLCIVDDAQWLDDQSARVLAFVVRRLQSEPVGVVLAERLPRTIGRFDGLPELTLDGLSYTEARTLLRSLIRSRFDETVLQRIFAESRGNPELLLNTVRGTRVADFAGGFAVVTAPTPHARPLDETKASIEHLDADSRRMLLVAAADPTGDPALYWRAATYLDIAPEATGPLEFANLLHVAPRVLFSDPRLRPAVYRLSSDDERRCVHAALAAATDAASDPDRRAWHLAHAVVGTDEDVALELERCVPKARERGGPAAAAAFLEKAALITLDASRRAERALAAAAAKLDAGAPDAAVRLLVAAEMGPPDSAHRSRLECQRARAAFAARRGNDASELLLRAASKLEQLDARVAGEAYLEALVAAIYAGRLSSGRGPEAIAKAVRGSLLSLRLPPSLDLLLRGLTGRFTDGYAAAHATLKQALDAVRDESSQLDVSRWLWLACRIAGDLWEDEVWHELTTLDLQRAEAAGSLAVLPYTLTYRSIVDVHSGDFASAEALVADADAIMDVTGHPPFAYTSLVLAAYRGEESSALPLIDAARHDAVRRGEGITMTTAGFAAAVLYNGLGRYDAALSAASDAAESDELGLFGWSLVELVEAASRSGQPDAGMEALQILTERARVTGTDWAFGIVARSRALLTDGSAAERFYVEAIERLSRSRIRVHLARAQLIYGEWLRRQGKRIDARAQLRAAFDAFVAMGATAFAERAHRELLATGETARRRVVETTGQLTPQEMRIAALARDGLTNTEIGERLFVSPRTVEYHLHKVFEKLGVRSRHELHVVLEDVVARPTRLSGGATGKRCAQGSGQSEVA
jgi:DNA-binding CsgD family transcriptional regulator